MAKWVFCPRKKMPVRVHDDEAAEIVDKGGRYLSINEARRMLAAAAKALAVVALLVCVPTPAPAQDDLHRMFRSSCDFWGNCYPRLREYRQRQRDYRRADRERTRDRRAVVREWEDCIESGRRRCGPKPYADYGRGYYDQTTGNGPLCVPRIITAKGGAAQTEDGALNQAKRAVRAMIRADFGEVYIDLASAKQSTYRCWRASTNESVLGRVGERAAGAFGFDGYQKRCQIWLQPCMPPRVPLEMKGGDRDSD